MSTDQIAEKNEHSQEMSQSQTNPHHCREKSCNFQEFSKSKKYENSQCLSALSSSEPNGQGELL